MRCHYGGWFRDGAGKVVLEGTVKVYLEGGDIEADIYSTFASTTAVHAVSSSATDGTFEFWISRFDYDTDQRFKLVLSKLGYTTKTYDNISVDDVVLDTYVIAADTTVTTQLIVPKGVIYQVASGKTLTISGPFDAGLYQIFSGTGAVTLSGAVKEVFPEWWGAIADGSTNSTNALNYALTCALSMPRHTGTSSATIRSGITLKLSTGSYMTSTGLSIPYDSTGNGYANILIKGSGSLTGTFLARYGTSSNLALIDIVGPADVQAKRTRHVTIEDIMIDGRFSQVGATGITYGVLARGFFTVNMNRVHVSYCNVGVFLTGGSEFKMDACVLFANSVNMRLEGADDPSLWGVPTTVTTDRSFIEEIWVNETQFYFAGEQNLWMNHAEHALFRRCYFQTPATAFSSVSILSSGYSGLNSSIAAHTVFEKNWFEGAPSIADGILQIIDVQNLDSLHMRGLQFKSNFVTSSDADNTWHFINLGDNVVTPGTGHIVDTLVEGNVFYYTAASTYPGLLKEGLMTSGTVVVNNSPIATYGGSRFSPYTSWGDFPTQLTDINTYPESLAEDAVFAVTGTPLTSGTLVIGKVYRITTYNANDDFVNVGGANEAPWEFTATGTTPTHWVHSSSLINYGWYPSDAAAITRAANADSFNGLATIELGDGAQAGALTLDYMLDVSRYREKVILVTFNLYCDVASNTFISMYPDGVNAQDIVANGNLATRMNFEITTAAGDLSNWRRVAFFVPINPIAPLGGSRFETRSIATLVIQFKRTSTDATKVVRIADLQVFVSNRYHNKLHQ